MSPKILRLLSTLALITTLVVNALANILPINGLNTGEVSDRYPSLFTPAGITFSIWTLIYGLLIAFMAYSWANHNEKRIDRILPWFIASCILNASWILVWHYLLPGLSVVIMLLLLATLLMIFISIQSSHFSSMKEMIMVSLPFTLYFAWICVATIANISALLISFNWNGGFMTPEAWTVCMMAVAAGLAFIVTKHFRTPAFIVVVMWALLGIYLRWQQTDHKLITVSAVSLEVVLAIVLVYYSRRKISH